MPLIVAVLSPLLEDAAAAEVLDGEGVVPPELEDELAHAATASAAAATATAASQLIRPDCLPSASSRLAPSRRPPLCGPLPLLAAPGEGWSLSSRSPLFSFFGWFPRRRRHTAGCRCAGDDVHVEAAAAADHLRSDVVSGP